MTLRLVNATNARDLGGLPTIDGRRIRPGLVFRANALNRLTDSDIDMLAKLELSCVVDLRSEYEIQMIGPDRLPSPPPGRLIALPLADPDHEFFASVTAVIRADTSLIAEYGPLDRDELVDRMLGAYRWLATSAAARAAYGSVLRLMAEVDTLPLLFHCTAGKDRTGWLAAVLLTALGVDRAVIAEDYLRTTDLNQPGIAYVIGRLHGRVPDPSVVLPVLEARAQYLLEAFAAAERVYGDMAAYLRDGLGLDEPTLADLRGNLLD